MRGGFPQTTQIDSITQTQRLLREDIIDKVLKRDMTARFGVRCVLGLEHTFLYLCMQDGGLLSGKLGAQADVLAILGRPGHAVGVCPVFIAHELRLVGDRPNRTHQALTRNVTPSARRSRSIVS